MSELLPGMEAFEPTVSTPIDACAVILWRRNGPRVDVFWLKREAKLAFAGGFYAQPGGRVDKADADVPVEGVSGLEATLRVTAARELLEETGVLKARGTVAQADIEAMRHALLDEKASFGELLKKHALRLHAEDFLDAGRWVTPPHLPRRYDTRFFLVEAPAEAKAEVWRGELTEGEWISPNAALNRWSGGTALLHPPQVYAFQTMAVFRSVESAQKALRNPPHAPDFIATRLEFQMGIRLFPVRTPTLPPATHTNVYVLGNSDLVVVDPGSPDDAETDKLKAFLEALRADGFKAKATILTHHHSDHVGGVKRLGLPVWCHAVTAQRLGITADRVLQDGEVLEIGGMRWKVLHTPGHASGHICLFDAYASKALIAGDMVAGIGTIVIDPPEGDMAEYLRQLQRLKDVGARTIYPSHGPPIPDGPAKLDEYVKHRAWREEKVLAALSATPQALEAIVPKAYDDVASFVLPVAERSTLAILEKLRAEGRVALDTDRWRRN
jgi:glyoxylase-like metal-dependent hydrolase (beta-lactamase superfamily II)/8-oxo-dGTP pyrophosphatase MutT (NUDIX family)